MTTRRNFIKQLGAVGLAATVPSPLFAMNREEKQTKKDALIWANLIHLSFNMWQDFTPDKYKTDTYPSHFDEKQVIDWAHHHQPHLTCEEPAWDSVIEKMAASGLNMAVIDLGDGVQYESHPEISVKNAWTHQHLKKKLQQMRAMGIEPIPKLNFSAGHKTWLGPHRFGISSDTYYTVCKNLIDEVVDIFDSPRFFHLGMDEETCSHQSANRHTVVRKGDLWWHDFYYLVDQVERHNVRSWIWSDNVWRNKEEFLRKMPKSVLQSNWNYEERGFTFTDDSQPNDALAQAFIDLEEHGFDQIPTGSLWLNRQWINYGNIERLVRHTKQIVQPKRLKGFMQTVWIPTLAPCLPTHYKAIEVMEEAKKKHY